MEHHPDSNYGYGCTKCGALYWSEYDLNRHKCPKEKKRNVRKKQTK